MGVETAIIGGSLIGAGASMYGSSKASKAASDASRASVAEQQRQFDLVRSDTTPYRQVGVSALDKLSRLYGLGGATPPLQAVQQPSGMYAVPGMPFGGAGPLMAGGFGRAAGQAQQAGGNIVPQSSNPDMSVFFTSPDYQFNLAEGQKAIDRSAAARGGLLSGAAVKAGERYASNLASGQLGSFYDRLANLAGLGQTGVAQSAAAGSNAANAISASYTNAGAQRGSAYMAGAEGVNNSAQGGIGNYLLYKYLRG